MPRLTRKGTKDEYLGVGILADLTGLYFPNKKVAMSKLLTKLGVLEDIEEELGIDIITLYDKFKSANETFNKNGLTTHKIFFTLFGRKWTLTRED